MKWMVTYYSQLDNRYLYETFDTKRAMQKWYDNQIKNEYVSEMRVYKTREMTALFCASEQA